MAGLTRHRNECPKLYVQLQALSQKRASRKRNAEEMDSEQLSSNPQRRQNTSARQAKKVIFDDFSSQSGVPNPSSLAITSNSLGGTPPDSPEVADVPLFKDNSHQEDGITSDFQEPELPSLPRRATHRRLPYIDVHPEGPGELLLPPSDAENEALTSQAPPESKRRPRTFTFRIPPAVYVTAANTFGVYREYIGQISTLPDYLRGLAGLTARTTQLGHDHVNVPQASALPHLKRYGPCRNQSIFAFKYWWWVLGGAKTGTSQGELADLFQWEGFDQYQVKRSDMSAVDDALSKPLELENPLRKANGWREHSVDIAIPMPGQQSSFDPHAPTQLSGFPESRPNIFSIPGLFVRSLSALIHNTLEQPASKWFHWRPFNQFWKSCPNSPQQRVYDELYSSPVWLEADKQVQDLDIPDCNLPRAIASLMFWSDATCVSDFGTRSLWPIYMFFGNQSKYDRSRPSNNAGHQVAFLPSIPDNIQDFIRNTCGTSASKDLLTFCKRELMHEAWQLLLDEDFREGWKHGWVIKCADGVTRRIFPRIFTYSADYPEKVLLATIRDKGGCPCPRCLIKMENTDKAGTRADMVERARRIRKDSPALQTLIMKARNLIFQSGKGVKSAAVEKLLKPLSLVPTVNVFSDLFLSINMNYYDIFVIDFLHEFELGVWKLVLTHLIRILHAQGEERVHIFDQRMRKTPLFGADTIRRITNNVSELKKMAARDFEDILQTIIPAIEDLVDPPHNAEILRLLYQLAEYHSLAKMRMHTDASLAHWDIVTVTLTESLRHFQQSSQAIRTVETPRERNNRLRRLQAESHVSSRGGIANGSTPRTLNLRTYKFHAMGDAAATVRRYGTTDSYTTQIGERQHRVPKSMYRRSSKNRHATRQVTAQEQRQRNLRYLAAHNRNSLPPSFVTQPKGAPKSTLALTEAELNLHHIIAADEKKFLHLPTWLNDPLRRTDPAFSSFSKNLRNHLLSRIKQEQVDEDFPSFSEEEQRNIFINSDRIYEHARLRVFYTTYDLRRAVDSIDLIERPDVMTPAYYDEDTTIRHPFWYARILGIYHANVSYGTTQKLKRMEFLWVRWFAWDSAVRGGWESQRLDRLAYDDLGHQFGFLDPAVIIRAAHLIPAWTHGRTKEYFPDSCMKHADGDFVYHYVNRFADRDMYLRYHGGGIGHCRSAGAAPPTPVQLVEREDLAQSRDTRETEANIDGMEYPELDQRDGTGLLAVLEGQEEDDLSTSSSEESDAEGSVYVEDDEGMDEFDVE